MSIGFRQERAKQDLRRIPLDFLSVVSNDTATVNQILSLSQFVDIKSQENMYLVSEVAIGYESREIINCLQTLFFIPVIYSENQAMPG